MLSGGAFNTPQLLMLSGIGPRATLDAHGIPVRVDLSGVMAMAPSFDVAGWFASGPGVFRKVGEVLLEGTRDESPVTRMVILDDAFENADPEVAALAHAVMAAAGLPGAIHERAAGDQADEWRQAFRVIQGYEI